MKIKYIIRRIRDLTRWIPIIWHDQDFDYSALLDLWEFKFRNMAEFFDSEYAITAGSGRTAKELRQCAELCHRINMDEYDDIPMKAHDAKWGKLKLEFEPTDHNTSGIVFRRPKAVSEKQQAQETKEFMRIVKAGKEQRQADIDRLCKLISKHLSDVVHSRLRVIYSAGGISLGYTSRVSHQPPAPNISRL